MRSNQCKSNKFAIRFPIVSSSDHEKMDANIIVIITISTDRGLPAGHLCTQKPPVHTNLRQYRSVSFCSASLLMSFLNRTRTFARHECPHKNGNRFLLSIAEVIVSIFTVPSRVLLCSECKTKIRLLPTVSDAQQKH